MPFTYADTWLRDGIVHFATEVAGPDRLARIAEEARNCRQDAFDRINDSSEIVGRRNGSIFSPQRCRAHRGGPELKGLVFDPEFIALLCDITGNQTLLPARYGLKFYSRGDYMAVHRDDPKCSVTVSFALTNDMDPMGSLPHMRNLSNDEVLELILDQGFFPSGGRDVELKPGTLVAFDGYNVPHWRPPHCADEGAILGTMCYFSI